MEEQVCETIEPLSFKEVKIGDRLLDSLKAYVTELIDDRMKTLEMAKPEAFDEDALRDRISDMVKDEISGYDYDDIIEQWFNNNFDISDHDIDDAVQSALENNSRLIRNAVRDLTFEVTVS